MGSAGRRRRWPPRPAAARTCATTCASRWRTPITACKDHHRARLWSPAAPAMAPGPGARSNRDLPDLFGHGQGARPAGFFTVERTCPTCNGQGQIVKNPARNVRAPAGSKRNARCRSHPAGVEDRHPHPPAGEGEAGMRGGPAGDLYLHRGQGTPDLHARRQDAGLPGAGQHGHRRPWRRDRGADHRRRPLTREGSPGTQSGKQLRLRGRACRPAPRPGLNGEAGDMLIELSVETPVNLTSRQRNCCASSRHQGRQQPADPGFLPENPRLLG